MEATVAKAAGLPDAPVPAQHDESNCEVHAQLHIPLMAAAWVPVLILLGLVLSACGQAVLADWRGAAEVWDRADGRFPEAMRTPAPLAGPLVLLWGAAVTVLPMVPVGG